MLLENKHFIKLETLLCLFRYAIIFITLFTLEDDMYLNENLFKSAAALFIMGAVWASSAYMICKRWVITVKRQYYFGLLEWVIDLIMIDIFAYTIGYYGDGFIYILMILLVVLAFVRYGLSVSTFILLLSVVGNTFFINTVLYRHYYALKNQNMCITIMSTICVIYLFYYICQIYNKSETAIARLELEVKGLKQVNDQISSLYTMSTHIYQSNTTDMIVGKLLKNIYRVVGEPGIGIILYDEDGIESNSKMYNYDHVEKYVLKENQKFPYKVVYAQREIETIREYKEYKNCILNHEPIVLENLPESLSYTHTILPGEEQKYVYMFNLMKDNRECGLVILNVRTRLEPTRCNHIDEIVYHAGRAMFKTQMLERERSKAIYDQLTGAKTRHYMVERLPHYVRTAKRTNSQLGVMFIDIDHFKHFNDRYSHATGDLVLKAVSKLIQERLSDEALIARYGGEEFVAFVPAVKRESMYEKVQSLRQHIADYNLEEITHDQSRITVSIGVAFYPKDGEKIEEVIKRADQAMYKVKQTTRNNVCLYDCIGGDRDE